MTLKEALESGKRFRRKGEINREPSNGSMCFHIPDILATDWEVEEERISLSAAEIREACKNSYLHTQASNYTTDLTILANQVIKKLGFKV